MKSVSSVRCRSDEASKHAVHQEQTSMCRSDVARRDRLVLSRCRVDVRMLEMTGSVRLRTCPVDL